MYPRALAALVNVPDHRDVQGPEGYGPHSLKKAEGEQDVEAAANAQAPPASPKISSAGTRIFYLPYLSERTPRTGVIKMPGRVKTVIRSPT